MVMNRMITNLNKNFGRMDKIQQQMATGKKFINPSDDPIGVSRSLRLNTELSNMTQYKRNLDDAQSWIDTTEIATNNVISVLQRARELTVQAANGTNTLQEREQIADELSQLSEQLVSIGNTSYAGSYIFSGFKTDKALLNKDGSYDIGGGTLNANENIQFNVGINEKIGINFVGQRIFGYMETTMKEQYELAGIAKFTGATVAAPNNTLNISYDGAPGVGITMDDKIYGPYGVKVFADDLNGKLSAAASPLKDKVRVEVQDGVLKLIGAKNISIDPSSTMNPDLVLKITPSANATISYVESIDERNIDKAISLGRYDHILKAGGNFAGVDTSTNNTFKLSYDGKEFNIAMKQRNYGTDIIEFVSDINDAIKTNYTELAGHVKFNVEDGKLNIVSDKQLTASAATTNPLDLTTIGFGVSSPTSTVMASNILEGSIKTLSLTSTVGIGASPDNELKVNYNGTDITLLLTQKTYDGTLGNTMDDLSNDIQTKINADPTLKGHMTVQNENGRITFYGDRNFSLSTSSTGSMLEDMGIRSNKPSIKLEAKIESGSKTQLIGVIEKLIEDMKNNNSDGISKGLKRLDAQISNISAVRAEIGVKTNRLELTDNRIQDDTINIKSLLSKNEDVNMAEVIMNLNMEENVYRASLSSGAKIIQPSLVDFLR